MEEPNEQAGLIIENNPTIRAFLTSLTHNPDLHDEHLNLATELSSQTFVSYKSIRTLWFALPTASRPRLLHLFSGSNFSLTSPKPREKSEKLKERLKKLEEMAERNAYDELVRDIKPRKETVEPFSSYKDQLGFGMHVVLTMFTGYLVGYAAFRALFNHSAVMNAAGGIFGLVCGMLLETVLFIVRTSSQDTASASTSKLKKH